MLTSTTCEPSTRPSRGSPDTGIAFDENGNTSHQGVDQIFKILGGKATSLKPGSLGSPNGITWDKANSRFVLGPFGSKSVQTWKEGDKAATTLVTGPGTYGGVEVLGDGRILVMSWADITADVVQGSTLSELVTGAVGPADIGLDTRRMVVAIPLFNDNRIAYHKIP